MKEFTDRCEHCGHLNLRGALHCDVCGNAISANLATAYKTVTKKSRNFLILSIVSIILAAAMIANLYGIIEFPAFIPSFILEILLFLSCGTAMYSSFHSFSNFIERSRYREQVVPTPAGNPAGAVQPDARLNDAELVKRMDDYRKRGKNLCIASIPFLLAGLIALIITGGEFSVLAIVAFVFFVAFFALLWVGFSSFGKATKMFKVNVVRDALASIIDGCVYSPEQSISRERIEATGLFRDWNKFRGEDYLRGTYKGHQIEFSDILLEHEYSSHKDTTRTDTIFMGHWLTCRLAKSLPAIIRLAEGAGEGNVETENAAFNQKYKIYTDDPHYMFYVLKPHFMEYIVAADEAADGRTFFYFAGSTVHIAVYNSRNIFEIDSDDKDHPDLARERIKGEMKYLTDILDELLRNESLL